jgi:MOSC domain-containing protein YiiM
MGQDDNLPHITQKHLMPGTILQVNISPGGLPKRPIAEGLITTLGLEGDAHAHPEFHGGPRKAILLIASEILEELQARGYPLFPGAMGENLTTGGIDIRGLRIGDRLRAGDAELEITAPRTPCRQLDVYGDTLGRETYDKFVKALNPETPRWGMSGFYASVVSPGRVRRGDIIAVVAKSA